MSLKKELVEFISEDEINTMVEDLAKQITAEYNGRPITLICPLKGSILFVSDLAKKLSPDTTINFVHLTSPKGESVRIHLDIQEDITNKDVLIVEEIIDAGRTLGFLTKRILASNPRSLKIVTLLDKPARREYPIKPDFIGKTIDDRFVVGYGMDSDEYGRNYKNILNYRN